MTELEHWWFRVPLVNRDSAESRIDQLEAEEHAAVAFKLILEAAGLLSRAATEALSAQHPHDHGLAGFLRTHGQDDVNQKGRSDATAE